MLRIVQLTALSFLAVAAWGCLELGPVGPTGDTIDGGTGGAADATLAAVESCNGVDDDGDNDVDEGCVCLPESSQDCWPGEPSQRGVGQCADGSQDCLGADEFAAWGPCLGAVLPGVEIPENGIDEDCDGSDGPCVAGPGGEQCSNGSDDDCDGLVDCYDPDCALAAACDGFCDPSPEICDDGIDNDCDDLIDCGDIEDCIDDIMSCTCIKMCPPGSVRWCDEPAYCAWGKQSCNPDGTWGACVETNERPFPCSGATYSPACCVLAGQCCQAFPLDDSIGDCPPMEIVCEET